MRLKQIPDLIKKSVTAWLVDYAPSMGAAIAYYTLFAITPLLIIAIAVAGFFFGHEAAQGEIIGQIRNLIGHEGAIAAFGKWLNSLFSGWEVFLFALDLSISFAITTLLFALIYKFMPRAKIPWQDVWIGAAVTAFLFAIGKFLIGLYLGKVSVASGFGAAGSLVILLLWVYFGAQIFLFGAKFTWVYSNTYGSRAAQHKRSEG